MSQNGLNSHTGIIYLDLVLVDLDHDLDNAMRLKSQSTFSCVLAWEQKLWIRL